MRKIYNRFWDWVFHPSIRRDPQVRGKAYLYRYPSPGSIYREVGPEDYKTPFQQTHYNVRYWNPTPFQRAERRSQTLTPGAGIDPIRKLVLLSYLKENDINNQTAIAEAKAKFKSAYGFNVEQIAYKNQLGLKIPNQNDKEAVRKFVQQSFLKASEVKKLNQHYGEQQQVQHPNIIYIESLDMYDSPHLQQARIQNLYSVDHLARARAETVENEGGLIAKQGNANFWKPLDDSNEPKNIKKVQNAIDDPQPLDFAIRDAKIKFEFDKNGEVVDIRRVKEKV